MEIRSDNPEHGFQFPGEFQLSAMGPAARDLETALPTLLLDAGIEVVTEQVDWKHSSNGRYVSVRIVFRAESRAVPERFAASDPYVLNGLVTGWRVREWTTVVGKDAAVPLD